MTARIIYLSQLFDPEPTFKGLKFIKGLIERGYDCEVVTGFPNYPGGKIYDGYRVTPIKRETLDSVVVTRLAIYPSHDRNTLKRMVCYFSFFLSALFYLLFRAKRADLVIVYYPSLTAGLAAVIAKVFRGTPVLVDIQDMWPDSLTSTGMVNSGIFMKFIALLCRVLYRGVDHITVLSPGFKRLLIDRGVPENKISLIYNFAEETAATMSLSTPQTFDTKREFQVLFAGNLGRAQGLTTILDAAVVLSKDQKPVTITFLGSGLEEVELKDRAKSLKLSNVKFMPRVALSDVQSYLKNADCLLVHLAADPLFKITIPSKTQAYLYAGRPVIMAVDGDAADLVREAKAGMCCPSDNADALAATIRHMRDVSKNERERMGLNGHKYYFAKLSFSRNLDSLSALIDKLKRSPVQRLKQS
jgi:colanic acid biosynthesis glycosyl transferase WcaI